MTARGPICLFVALLLIAAPSAQAFDERPMKLPPPAAGVAAASAQPDGWIVGAEPDGASRQIARRFGARLLAGGTAYGVRTKRARALAAALRRAGRLTYAEPDVELRRTSAFDATPGAGPRTAVVDAGLTPPAPIATGAIAIVDDLVDVSLPDLASNTRQVNPGPVLGRHGTQVASAAGAVLNGSGVFGVFPGAPLLSVGLPPQITCSAASAGIIAAAREGARVINLSFGTAVPCSTLFEAVERAYAAGSLVVAATGNEFAAGNPVIYPAAFAHVLSVAALDQSLQPTEFSTANAAVDVAAPGVDVPVAVPFAYDTDGSVDGVSVASGTSFSAPIVSGAAAWLATVRPTLRNGQIADILRSSARDAGAPGYDASTGYGLVHLASALAAPTPANDVLEPNDGITFVDGSVFMRADPFVWKGTAKRTLSGSVDRIEDPVDVLRISMPARALLRIRLRPRSGNPNLAVYRGSARALGESERIIARSRRSARATDSVRFTNRSRRAATAYVVVDVSTLAGTPLNASYRLEFQRLRRR